MSTDGDEALNDEVRGKEGGWARQMETYRRLHELRGVKVVLGMTLSSYNANQFDRAFAAAKQVCPWLKPRDFHMNLAHESSHYYGNSASGAVNKDVDSVGRQVQQYRSLRGFSLSPVGWLERRYLKHAESYLRTRITPMRCHALRSLASSILGGTSTPVGCTRPASPPSGNMLTISSEFGLCRAPRRCKQRSGITSARNAGPRARPIRVFSATSRDSKLPRRLVPRWPVRPTRRSWCRLAST